MATRIYETHYISTVDGLEIEISPLKIKYLRQFMDTFYEIEGIQDEEQRVLVLSRCAAVAMKQFVPEIASVEGVEDSFDIKTIYKILDICGGIKFEAQEEIQDTEEQKEGSTWKDMKLDKLEAEAFLIGSWKNIEELETSLCLAELMALVEAKREQDYNNKKFAAALKGVDLDKQSGEEDPWEKLKAKVASKGKTTDSNDIVSLQGKAAAQAGFGIGMGLDYEVQE